MQHDNIDPEKDKTIATAGLSIFGIIILTWLLVGIAAFIYSLICFGKSGTTTDKFLGLVLSVLFGPLYFIYVIFNTKYCR